MAEVRRNGDDTVSITNLASEQVAALGATLDLVIDMLNTPTEVDHILVQLPGFRSLVHYVVSIRDALQEVNRGALRAPIV